MRSARNTELILLNIGWLRDALQLVARLDDAAFSTAPANLPGQRAGSHLRHILEFYECFLDGIAGSRIDYDARPRDERVETSLATAAERIRFLIRALEEDARLLDDRDVLVRAESGDAWLKSTASRELQALSSHTIHHFALIAVILRLHGIHLDPDFGMSPSTLRYKTMRAGEAA
jgi:uncharacterized damage-inducible protein DinB